MKMDDTTKDAVQQLVNVVQLSVDNSPVVQSAMQNLQFLGFVPNFTVRMDLELTRPPQDGLTDTRVRIA